MAPTRSRTLAGYAIAVAAIPLSVYALCGCSGQSSAVNSVASIPATAAQNRSAPSASASAGSNGTASSGADSSSTGRPQMRLDDSPARRAALINAWSQCLISHGATKQGEKPNGLGTTIIVAEPIPAKAKAACENLLPELPPELNAATNPNFHEQVLKYVSCMQQRGLWVQLLDNSDTDWTFAPGHAVPSNEQQIEHTCQLQAFGNK